MSGRRSPVEQFRRDAKSSARLWTGDASGLTELLLKRGDAEGLDAHRVREIISPIVSQFWYSQKRGEVRCSQCTRLAEHGQTECLSCLADSVGVPS